MNAVASVLAVSVFVVCDQVVPAHQVDDIDEVHELDPVHQVDCLLYTSPSPRDRTRSRMPSSA